MYYFYILYMRMCDCSILVLVNADLFVSIELKYCPNCFLHFVLKLRVTLLRYCKYYFYVKLHTDISLHNCVGWFCQNTTNITNHIYKSDNKAAHSEDYLDVQWCYAHAHEAECGGASFTVTFLRITWDVTIVTIPTSPIHSYKYVFVGKMTTYSDFPVVT